MGLIEKDSHGLRTAPWCSQASSALSVGGLLTPGQGFSRFLSSACPSTPCIFFCFYRGCCGCIFQDSVDISTTFGYVPSLYRCQGRRCRRDAARVAHLYSHCPWIRNPGAISVLAMQPLGGRGWRTKRGVCSLVNVSTSSGMLSVHFPKKDV